MPKRPPKYSLHKPSGRARVRINGKDIYLGDFDSRESRERYNQVVAKWLTGKCDFDRDAPTLSRLAIMYFDFARGCYRKDGSETATAYRIQMALKPLIRLNGRENAACYLSTPKTESR